MRFSPNVLNPVIVSCGWDKVVKVCLFNVLVSLFIFPAARDVLRNIFATSESTRSMRLHFPPRSLTLLFPSILISANIH